MAASKKEERLYSRGHSKKKFILIYKDLEFKLFAKALRFRKKINSFYPHSKIKGIFKNFSLICNCIVDQQISIQNLIM